MDLGTRMVSYQPIDFKIELEMKDNLVNRAK
jgi:hypothetical protein